MARSSASSRDFVRVAMRAPYLERDEEHDLAVRWHAEKDQAALHRLTAAHMRLVIAIAARFRNFGLPMGDLIQEGHVGLLEAAARFDPGREVRFSTYATWWIRASIQDYRARLARGTDQRPRQAIYAEIAGALGVHTRDVELMDSRLSAPDTSLNAPLHDQENDTAKRQDFLVDGTALPDELVGEHVDQERRLTWLRSALTVLNERELRIVSERRLRDEGATLESLGESLGISKERVRQIENRALEKLRTVLLREHPETGAFV